MSLAPDRSAVLRLRATVDRELRSLARCEARVANIVPRLGAEHDEVVLAAAGKWLADTYTAIERILRSVAITFEGLPAGPDWHRELVSAAAAEVSGVRPATIDSETARLLSDYLGFRHVFRSLYAEDLRRERVLDLAERLPATLAAFQKDVAQFRMFLDRLVKA
ncbi:MAG: hypothetical protein HYY17_17025 [Planctomycetes bacterium]|nr:hypothetical protein [Planctomycetota bacterium]